MNNEKQTTEEKAKVVLEFFKEAFCVDGEVRFATSEENAELNKRKLYFIRLEDSKRGIFFVASE